MGMRNRPIVLALATTLALSACSGSPPASPTGSNDPIKRSADSSIPVDVSTRTGWILLEYVGGRLAFGASPTADAPVARSLWLVRPDGSELHELAPGVPKGGKTNPTWSRDGRLIAFQTVGRRCRVYETDASASILVSVSGTGSKADPGESCGERTPAYSPDANHLAFVSSTDGMTDVIGIRARCVECRPGIGSGSQRFSFHGTYSTLETTRMADTAWIEGLSWSPNGTQIAYDRITKDAYGEAFLPLAELWLVNVDDSDSHRIPLPAGLSAFDPDWSPDGSLIVFNSGPMRSLHFAGEPGPPDVYTVRPDGSDLQRLTSDGRSGGASWTSDGKILFYSDPWMWLMDADGSNAAPVLSEAPAMWGSRWGEPSGWSQNGHWQPAP
jgi:TolB protein